MCVVGLGRGGMMMLDSSSANPSFSPSSISFSSNRSGGSVSPVVEGDYMSCHFAHTGIQHQPFHLNKSVI